MTYRVHLEPSPGSPGRGLGKTRHFFKKWEIVSFLMVPRPCHDAYSVRALCVDVNEAVDAVLRGDQVGRAKLEAPVKRETYICTPSAWPCNKRVLLYELPVAAVGSPVGILKEQVESIPNR